MSRSCRRNYTKMTDVIIFPSHDNIFCCYSIDDSHITTLIKKALTISQSLVELTHPNANILVFMGGFGITALL